MAINDLFGKTLLTALTDNLRFAISTPSTVSAENIEWVALKALISNEFKSTAAIVGIDGDYATVYAAILGGETRIYVKDNTIEPTWDLDGKQNFTVYGDGFTTITFDNKFIDFGTTSPIVKINGVKIIEQNLGGSNFLFVLSTSSIFDLTECEITLNSAKLNSGTSSDFNIIRSKVNLSNEFDAGAYQRRVFDSIIVGGGDLSTFNCGSVDGMELQGSFYNNTGINTLFIYGVGANINRLVNNASNVFNIRTDTDNVSFTNCNFGGTNLRSSSGVDRHYNIINCFNFGFNPGANGFWSCLACTLKSGQTLNDTVELINCETDGLTINGDFCRVAGGDHTSIIVNGDFNEITGVKKSTSISVNVSSVSNRVISCNSDAAIASVPSNTFFGNYEY